MNFIYNREDFKRYIRQTLGEPAIRVDVVETQIENCVNDALDFWTLNHYEGTIQTFLKQRVTASTITLCESLVEPPRHGETVEALDSHTKCRVVKYSIGASSSNNTVFVEGLRKNSLVIGEHIKIGAHTYTVKDYKLGIIDEQRVKVPEWVVGVTRIIPISQASSSQNLFDVQYQLRLNDIYDLTSTDIIYYDQAMTHLELLNFELNSAPNFQFNRHEGYVYPIMKWKTDISAGDYLIFEVYRDCNPKDVPQVWNNNWLRKYAVALVRRQWGQNLSKFNGVQLPGGLTLDGQSMYQQAQQEIQALEDECRSLLPPSAFLIG